MYAHIKRIFFKKKIYIHILVCIYIYKYTYVYADSLTAVSTHTPLHLHMRTCSKSGFRNNVSSSTAHCVCAPFSQQPWNNARPIIHISMGPCRRWIYKIVGPESFKRRQPTCQEPWSRIALRIGRRLAEFGSLRNRTGIAQEKPENR